MGSGSTVAPPTAGSVPSVSVPGSVKVRSNVPANAVVPLNEIGLVSVRAVPSALTVHVTNVNRPVPAAELLAIRKVPAANVRPPE